MKMRETRVAVDNPTHARIKLITTLTNQSIPEFIVQATKEKIQREALSYGLIVEEEKEERNVNM